MSHTISESRLEFCFSDAWRVIKFDECPEYQRLAQESGKQNLPGTKGVDFVGIWNEMLYFIEVKDFRTYRIENRPKLEAGTLAVELGQKVHSSIACLIGFYRTSPTPELWSPFAHLLCTSTRRIKVVLWLEHELPVHPVMQRKALNSLHIKNFKPRLQWITPYVFISNQETNVLTGVEVHNLPHPQL